MKKIDAGSGLQIIANVGVLAGLLLLVYELNQTRELSQAQFEIDRDTGFQTSEIPMLGSNLSVAWEKSIFDPDSLSVSEIRSLDSFYAIQISRLNNTWDLEQRGILPSGRTAYQMDLNVPFYFGNAFSQSVVVVRKSELGCRLCGIDGRCHSRCRQFSKQSMDREFSGWS